jgi:hypothetical protein
MPKIERNGGDLTELEPILYPTIWEGGRHQAAVRAAQIGNAPMPRWRRKPKKARWHVAGGVGMVDEHVLQLSPIINDRTLDG